MSKKKDSKNKKAYPKASYYFITNEIRQSILSCFDENDLRYFNIENMVNDYYQKFIELYGENFKDFLNKYSEEIKELGEVLENEEADDIQSIKEIFYQSDFASVLYSLTPGSIATEKWLKNVLNDLDAENNDMFLKILIDMGIQEGYYSTKDKFYTFLYRYSTR
jgi:hypothetical protein